MYEKLIAKKQKIMGNRKLVIMVSISIAVLLFVTGLFLGAYLYYTSFRGFVGDLSAATSISFRKGTVQVTMGDEEFPLSQENVYFIYNAIVNAGRGRLAEPPERQPDAVITYQFGGKLELWEVDMGNNTGGRKKGLFISFTNLEGKVYSYDTDRLGLDRLPLDPEKNVK